MLIDAYGNHLQINGGDSVLQSGGNLINALECVHGSIDSKGEAIANANNYITPFVDVSHLDLPKTLVTTRAGATSINPSMACYNAEKVFIKSVANQSGSLTIPSGTYYVRFVLINGTNYGAWIDGEARQETMPHTPSIKQDFMPINNRWRGKNVCFLGDSFISMNIYPYVCAGLLEVGKYYCWGQNGRMLNSYASAFDSLLTQNNLTINDFDMIVVLGGTNDFSAGYGTTETGANNGVTVSSANLIEHLLGLNPDIQIVFGTPTYRNGYNGSTDTDAKGHHISEYADGIRNTCRSYGIPCFDFYGNCGINRINVATTTRDGLHPTDEKFVEMGTMMAKFIASL